MHTSNNPKLPCEDCSKKEHDGATKLNKDCGCSGRVKSLDNVPLRSTNSENLRKLFVPKDVSIDLNESITLDELENFGHINIVDDVILKVSKIENKGRISCKSGSLELHFEELESSGCIEAKHGRIVLHKITDNGRSVNFTDSKITAAEEIDFLAAGNLYIRGGDFAATELNVTVDGALTISAESIDAPIHIKAETVATGVQRGKLNIASTCVSGDPLFWNTSGDVHMQINAAPADFIAFASGNVTASADIDARNVNGGVGGKIFIAAGVQFSPPVGESPDDCIDCSALYQLQIPPVPSGNGGSVNMSGIDLLTNSNPITIYAYGSGGSGGNIVVNNVVSAGLNGAFAGDITMIADGAIDIGGNIDARGSGNGDAGNIQLTTVHGYINIDGDILNTGPNAGKIVKLVTSFSGEIVVGGDISARGGVTLQTPDTSTDKIAVDGNITIDGQSLIAKAGGNVAIAGNVSTNSSTALAGAVDIQANLSKTGAAASTKFLVGTPSTNGIGGIVSAQSVSVPFGRPWIHLRNLGNGGIELVSGSKINVISASGRSSDILLIAPEGPIKLVGALSANGSSSVRAGSIYISGDILDTTGGPTTISVNDSLSNVGRRLAIGVREIKYDLNGLQLLANGDGPNSQLLLVTKGGIGINITYGTNIVYTPVISTTINKELKINGSGQLEIRANGSQNNVSIFGAPLTISGGDAIIEANGANTIVGLEGRVANSAPNGLVLGSQSLTVHANGTNNSKGGQLLVRAHSPKVTSTNFSLFTADGGGTGGGGLVDFQCVGVTSGADPISLGYGAQMIAASAKGGSTSGDGGTISFQTASLGITFNGDSAGNELLNVNVQGTDGAGGTIILRSDGPLNIVPPPAAIPLQITANGKGQGKGGTVTIEQRTGSNTIDVGINTNFSVSAKPGTTGDGGRVTINTTSFINLKGANVTVSPDSNGDGKGGFITVTVDPQSFAKLTASGIFNANAVGPHDGGDISFQAPIIEMDSATVTVDGGTNGSAGNILLYQTSPFQPFEIKATSPTLISAFGGTSGSSNGGDISIASYAGIKINNGVVIDASGRSALGNGGAVLLQAAFQPSNLQVDADLTIAGTVRVNNGGGTGQVEGILLSIGHSGSGVSIPGNPNIKLKNTAIVRLEGSSQSPGVLRVENRYPQQSLINLQVQCEGASQLASPTGIVRFSSPNDATIDNGGLPLVAPTNAISGTVEADVGNNLILFAGVDNNLHLGSIKCKEATIQSTQNSSILSDTGLVECDVLNIVTQNGSIGDPGNRLKTKTSWIFPVTQGAAPGTIDISNLAPNDRLRLQPRTIPGHSKIVAGGNFYLESTGCIYVAGGGGSNGKFEINGSFTCISTNGSIYIEPVFVEAHGDIKFGLASVPGQIAGQPNPNFQVSGPHTVYWGASPGVQRQVRFSRPSLLATGHDIYFKSDIPGEIIRFKPAFTTLGSDIVLQAL